MNNSVSENKIKEIRDMIRKNPSKASMILKFINRKIKDYKEKTTGVEKN